MINFQLINPKSIVEVGASNDLRKAGGKLLHYIISGDYSGQLLAVNKREDTVQGIKSFNNIEDLPNVEMAILSIPAHFCPDAIEKLAKKVKKWTMLLALDMWLIFLWKFLIKI